MLKVCVEISCKQSTHPIYSQTLSHIIPDHKEEEQQNRDEQTQPLAVTKFFLAVFQGGGGAFFLIWVEIVRRIAVLILEWDVIVLIEFAV